MGIQKQCKHCNKIFTTYEAWSKQGGRVYCNRKCYLKSVQKTKKCVECGEEFYKNTPVITCSKECANKRRSKATNKRISRHCVVCNKMFNIPPAWIRKGGGHYCSRECRWSVKIKYSKKQKAKAVNKINYAIKMKKLRRQPCYICGEEESNAHHHMGYAKDHIFDIVWLCDLHHSQEHERLRKSGLANVI